MMDEQGNMAKDGLDFERVTRDIEIPLNVTSVAIDIEIYKTVESYEE